VKNNITANVPSFADIMIDVEPYIGTEQGSAAGQI